MNRSSSRRSLPSLLLLTTISMSCSGPGARPNPAAPATSKWQLSGTVTEKSVGGGLPDAKVEVSDGPDAGTLATTNASGAYTFDALAQAGFTLKASKPGFVTQSQPVTLTQHTKLGFALERASANVKAVFEPTALPVTSSGNSRYPRQLLFTLYIQETNSVDVTVQAIEFGLVMPDGHVARWWFDNAALLEHGFSLLVRGGTWKAFGWNLIYDGAPSGTLNAVVQATDSRGEQYRIPASASVGGANAATSSPLQGQSGPAHPTTASY